MVVSEAIPIVETVVVSLPPSLTEEGAEEMVRDGVGRAEGSFGSGNKKTREGLGVADAPQPRAEECRKALVRAARVAAAGESCHENYT